MTSPMVEAIATIVEAKDAEIDRLKAELKEAREALKPFAEEAGSFDDAIDEHWKACYRNEEETVFTIGDLRRARAFLDRTGE